MEIHDKLHKNKSSRDTVSLNNIYFGLYIFFMHCKFNFNFNISYFDKYIFRNVSSHQWIVARVDVSCAPDTRVHEGSLQGCLAKIFPPHFLYFERSSALLKLFA